MNARPKYQEASSGWVIDVYMNIHRNAPVTLGQLQLLFAMMSEVGGGI